MTNYLFLDQQDNPNYVDEADHDEAIKNGLEPAYEMVTPDGETTYVRRSHYDDAKKSGLKFPHEPIAEKEADERFRNEKISPIESMARGFANNATFGSADEIQAAASHPIGAAKSLGGLFGADNSQDKDVQNYVKKRNDYRVIDDASYKQNPWYQRAGNVGAGLVGGGASLLEGGAKAAAKYGAAQGAGGGFGGGSDEEGQADLSKGEIAKLLAQTGLGAAAGAAGGAATHRVARYVDENALPKMKDLAERLTYRATGALKTNINKNTNDVNKIGRELRDQGIVKFGDRRGGKAIMGRLQSKLDDFDTKQNDFLQGLDAAGHEGVPVNEIPNRLRKSIEEYEYQPGLNNTKVASAIQAEFEDYMKKIAARTKSNPRNVTPSNKPAILGSNLADENIQGPISHIPFEDALKVKRGYAKGSKFESNTDRPAVEASRLSYDAANQSIDDSVEGALGAGSSAPYKRERQMASRLLDSKRALDDAEKRSTVNKTFGLTDSNWMSGGIGASLGTQNPWAMLGTMGLLATKKAGETFGDSSSAVILDLAEKIISQYGMEDGIKRISQTFGPRMAQEVIANLQKKLTQQGRDN
jgi:hypothetical protein